MTPVSLPPDGENPIPDWQFAAREEDRIRGAREEAYDRGFAAGRAAMDGPWQQAIAFINWFAEGACGCDGESDDQCDSCRALALLAAFDGLTPVAAGRAAATPDPPGIGLVTVRYHGENGWWADSDDLAGWTATSDTLDSLRAKAREGVFMVTGKYPSLVHGMTTGNEGYDTFDLLTPLGAASPDERLREADRTVILEWAKFTRDESAGYWGKREEDVYDRLLAAADRDKEEDER